MKTIAPIRLPAALLMLAACGDPLPEENLQKTETLEQLLSVCQGSQTLPGVDVSSYQGNIDWAQVAASGIKFGYTKATEALGYQDPTFNANWSGMKAHGIARGAYHFFHPNESGAAQADYYLAFVGALGAGDLPPMLDWEISSGASGATAAANAQAFVNEIKAKTGKTTIIYTSPGLWSGFGVTQSFSAQPLWVAHYLYCTGGSCCPTMPSGWNSWQAWQWSDKGSVPGISGNVDLDLFNGTEAALSAFGGGEVCNGPVGHGLGNGGAISGGACGGAAPAVTASSACGTLSAGQGLTKGHSLTSCDGRFELAMQTDGNLVAYSNGIALWATSTVGSGDVAVMQGDGNLVVYSAQGCAVWASKTDGNPGGTFALQTDGNLVVYDATGHAKWATGTGSMGAKPAACGELKSGEGLAPGESLGACGGCFNLVLQGDGNLVMYKKNGTAIWNSVTAGSTGYSVDVASSGDVTLWSKEGCSLWSSNTSGHSGSRLAVQDDGNLVVYDTSNQAVWSSGSVSCAGGCNCNPPPPPPPPMDAGTTMTSHDAGTTMTPHDGGTTVTEPDAGTTMSDADAGAPGELSPGDGGATTPPTGMKPMGTEPPQQMTGGCHAAGPELMTLAALSLMLRRRRHAAAAGCAARPGPSTARGCSGPR